MGAVRPPHVRVHSDGYWDSHAVIRDRARTIMAVPCAARIATRALAVIAVAMALGAGAASAATLKADYQFQDTHASSVPGASTLADLVAVGNAPNSFVTDSVAGTPRRVLAFPKGNGLAMSSLRSLLPSGSYSVVLLVRLAEISGYRRYLDFTGGSSDSGFYNLSGNLVLYPAASGTAALITANAYQQIAVTRDANGTVVGYVDATVALGPYDDSSTGAAAPTTDTLRFFKDDDAVAAEESAGAVARIRLYDGALTASEVAALAPVEQQPPPPPPPPDSDGDGLSDAGDACPTVPAATANGCPVSAASSPPPPPVLGKAVNIAPVKGEVFVSVPAGTARASASVPGLKGRRFVPLSQARQIPVGSILDTRKGTVRMTTASTAPGRTQSSDFLSGVFQVLQSRNRSARGLTELRLKGSSFRACGARSSAKRSSSRAQTARRSRRTIRRLRGSGSGRFRTRGRYSSATVRGTDWTVSDRCDGTLTRVTRGRVAVRDFRRRKTVRVRAGKSYLASPRR